MTDSRDPQALPGAEDLPGILGPDAPAPGAHGSSAGEQLVHELTATDRARLGVRLRWREAGNGPNTVLFVHGFPLSGAIWNDQLADVPDGWRYLAPDLPGFGGTPPLPVVTMEILARELEIFLDYRGVASAVVCGLSMGGYVAFALRRLNASRVRALVLADTRAGADDPEAKHARYESAARARAEGGAVVADAMLPRLVAPRTVTERLDVMERLRRIVHEPTAEGIATALEGMAERPDSTPMLGELDIPTLVVVGEEDEIAPPAEAQRMAGAIARASLVVVPGAGHLTPMERPAEFNAALKSFLESLT